MTNQAIKSEEFYYIGQAVKPIGSQFTDIGHIVDVKPETSNLSMMTFGGAAMKRINYKMVIVWEDGKLQRNANEHEVLHLKGHGDISEIDALILLIEAEQAQNKANDLEAQRKEAERVEFNKSIETFLADPQFSHLEPMTSETRGGGKFTATNIRKHLKTSFPGVKFSVKSDYSSINVRWEDGPTQKAVEEKINCFSNGGFDAYSDYHYTKNSPFNNAFGGVQFLFIDRDCSDELIQLAINKAVDGWNDCEHITLENYKKGFHTVASDSNIPDREWSRMIREEAETLDFTPETPVKPIKAAVKTDGVTIEQHTHTKRGFEIWIVILAARVEREEYLSLLDQAKSLNGWYSRKWGTTPAGFAFKSLEAAEQFAATLGGTPPQDKAPLPETADKLEALADKMQPAIDHKMNPNRLTNTPKRQREAATAHHEGDRLKRTQQALYGLATHHRNGTTPANLVNIKSKKAVYDLMGSEIEHNGAYYDAGHDTGKPRIETPVSLALWQLITPKSEDELKQEALQKKIDDLQFSKIPGYFPTPNAVIDQMIDLVNPQEGEKMLEPEAGHGAICDRVKEAAPLTHIQAFETQHSLQEILRLKNIDLIGSDFLETEVYNEYDCVIMNPPFENLQDIDHVLHAYNALKEGGRMAAVMSPSPFSNQNSKAAAFRQWFEKYDGYKIDLPENSFKQSGTNVNTILIYIEK